MTVVIQDEIQKLYRGVANSIHECESKFLSAESTQSTVSADTPAYHCVHYMYVCVCVCAFIPCCLVCVHVHSASYRIGEERP